MNKQINKQINRLNYITINTYSRFLVLILLCCLSFPVFYGLFDFCLLQSTVDYTLFYCVLLYEFSSVIYLNSLWYLVYRSQG